MSNVSGQGGLLDVARYTDSNKQTWFYFTYVKPLQDGHSATTLADMFEGLVTEDLHGNIIPALASQWDVSEDGKQYTFHLRDAKWSNGEPITANDFVFSLKRIVDPKTGAPYSWYIAMASIVNGDEITQRRETCRFIRR